VKLYKLMAVPTSICGRETWIVRKTRIQTAEMKRLYAVARYMRTHH